MNAQPAGPLDNGDRSNKVDSGDRSNKVDSGDRSNKVDAGPDDASSDDLARIEIDIPARTDLVTVVRMVVAAAATAAQVFDGDRLDDLRWITSEAVTNAIEADRRIERNGRVQVTVRIASDRVFLTVADQGGGLPDLVDVPDIEHPDRLLIEGGFGVPLMQHLSSGDVHFTSTPEGTTVDLELHR